MNLSRPAAVGRDGHFVRPLAHGKLCHHRQRRRFTSSTSLDSFDSLSLLDAPP